MGRPGMAEKMKKTCDPRWLPSPHWPAGSGRVRRRLAMKFGRRGHLTLPFLPSQRVCKGGGRNRLPRLKPNWPESKSKRPNLGSTGLGEFF